MNFKLLALSVVIYVTISTTEARDNVRRTAGDMKHSLGGSRGSTNVEIYPLNNYDCVGKVDGNYPHPNKCDYYVACVAQTHAYEMPCQMGLEGKRLHFVRNSGPNIQTSRCDRPEVAQCPFWTDSV